MLPLQELATNLNLSRRELVIPLDTHRFFYVDAENTKNFIDQVLELEESDMKFFNVKQSQPYSNSLDKATIVNNSKATIMQQETFTKTTTDSFTFTNTRGFTKGGAVNATIGTPFLGGVGTTLNLSFNVSNTASTAKTVSQSRSQQQTITVPAQTSLVATWVIKNVDIDAEYKMTLKAGPKAVIKCGLVPGKVVTTDVPVLSIYRYSDEKGEKFMYYPSSELQQENWHLEGLNPVFYVPQPSPQYVQAGGSHRYLKSLFKGSHGVESRALVPVNLNGSANVVDQSQNLQICAQYEYGTVPLWRYRKETTAEPQYRLEAANSPESIPGWINEGSVGYVFASIPGMRDAEYKGSGHPHALNEILPDDKDHKQDITQAKKRTKCSKCWRKIELPESQFKCEQCKTYVLCADCYQASDKTPQKNIEDAASKFNDLLGALADYKKTFNVTGRMHGTQGTHTFINISPMSDSDKDSVQEHTKTPEVVETKEEQKEKSKTQKGKKYVEEIKFKKQYVEMESDEQASSYKKTEKKTQLTPPSLPSPPPPLPQMSSLTIQEPLPPPPPPLPEAVGLPPPPAGNPYYTTPLQSFINNPSTVQPYFLPQPPPPPASAAPGFIGPLPFTNRTIETPLPQPAPKPFAVRRQTHPTAAPASPAPPPPSMRKGSIDDIYSIPMGQYNAASNPHFASPIWEEPKYEERTYEQPKYSNYQYNQQNYQPTFDGQGNYSQPNYNYQQQNYNQPNNYGQQNYSQNYNPPYNPQANSYY